MLSVLTFETELNLAGYEWRRIQAPRGESFDDPAPPDMLLVGIRPQQTKLIRPLELDPVLYLNLADIALTPARVIEFANKYGPLAHNLNRFGQWRDFAEKLKREIQWWDMFCASRGRSLKSRIERACNEAGYGGPDVVAQALLADRDKSEAERLRSIVAYRINQHVQSSRVCMHEVDGEWRIGIEPSCLADAIWLQMAASVGQAGDVRQCEACGVYFKLSVGVNRADRKTCSNACRNRALRRRQAQARELRIAGKTLREIAKEVGSDVPTVKNWVSTKGG
jgi:hypothetical protein